MGEFSRWEKRIFKINSVFFKRPDVEILSDKKDDYHRFLIERLGGGFLKISVFEPSGQGVDEVESRLGTFTHLRDSIPF